MSSMALEAGICTALNETTLLELRKGGIKTVVDFITQDPELLSKELHIAYKDICSIRRVLLAEHSAYPVSAASLYHKALNSLAILSTGSDSLDQLLDGGLYTGEVTELAGDTAAGKTKICLWSAASTVRSQNQSVVYIDTCASFSADCIVEVVTEDHMADESVTSCRLAQIQCVQLFDVFELFAALDNILSQHSKSLAEHRSLKLVVVDNLASLIYPILGTQAAYSQGLISQLGLKLNQLAMSLSVAVLVTNNLASAFKGSERKPALGKAWSHVPQTRLIVGRAANMSGNAYALREARLIKSSRQETPATAMFSLDRGHHKPD